MRFSKYQGAGNDFLIADNRNGEISVEDGVLVDSTGRRIAVAEICDRRYGIGADGLMLLEAGNSTDFRMTYFNSDGSGGMMCGNGGRCIVAFAADRGVKPSGPCGEYVFDAADGLHEALILEDNAGQKIVRLKMKDVSEAVHYDMLTGVAVSSEGWFLDTGTRHYVRRVTDLQTYDVVKDGREIRYNASELQPVGANVNFIEPSDTVLNVRTYEKGVEDETFACGTGIVASAMAAYLSGITPHSENDGNLKYEIQAKRDRLSVEFTPDSKGQFAARTVYLTGPAAYFADILL